MTLAASHTDATRNSRRSSAHSRRVTEGRTRARRPPATNSGRRGQHRPEIAAHRARPPSFRWGARPTFFRNGVVSSRRDQRFGVHASFAGDTVGEDMELPPTACRGGSFARAPRRLQAHHACVPGEPATWRWQTHCVAVHKSRDNTSPCRSPEAVRLVLPKFRPRRHRARLLQNGAIAVHCNGKESVASAALPLFRALLEG